MIVSDNFLSAVWPGMLLFSQSQEKHLKQNKNRIIKKIESNLTVFLDKMRMV